MMKIVGDFLFLKIQDNISYRMLLVHCKYVCAFQIQPLINNLKWHVARVNSFSKKTNGED